MNKNIITLTDSYKVNHWNQYPTGTEYVYSYFEARTGAKFSYTVFFGLQYLIKEYLAGRVVTREKIEQAAKLAAVHFGSEKLFNRKMWEHILEKHEGRLPVRIKAVPEGLPIPNSNVLMTIENTDPLCYSLTNHLETLLSHCWYGSTVATLSRKVKEQIKLFLDQTASSDAGLPFMLHDFGFRGVSSVESAGIGGAGHLVNFMGTDTIKAIELAMEYYGADVCAYSVPATEHSVMTALGPEGEEKMFADLIKNYPTGILSVVSDSYDIFRACSEIIGTKLKDQILARDGVFVIRPDSGDPVSTVMKILEILGEKMGVTVNQKGFRVLNPKVKVLWGDGLDYDKIYDILNAMKNGGWSAENIACFGMGGGLLQRVNRDTQRFAFKSSAQCREGIWYDIFKEPVDKSKTSKKGKLALYRATGEFHTVTASTFNDDDVLETVFEDGELKRDMTFDQVRKNAAL
jgi:nicotinamide phosphoribosyltransferase